MLADCPASLMSHSGLWWTLPRLKFTIFQEHILSRTPSTSEGKILSMWPFYPWLNRDVDFSTFELNKQSLPELARYPQFVVSTREDDWFGTWSRTAARGCLDAVVWIQCVPTQMACPLLPAHWCCLEATDWFPVNREDIELPQDKIIKADLGPKLDHLQ